LGAGDVDGLEEGFEVAGDRFALFWEAVPELEVGAFPCFWE